MVALNASIVTGQQRAQAGQRWAGLRHIARHSGGSRKYGQAVGHLLRGQGGRAWKAFKGGAAKTFRSSAIARRFGGFGRGVMSAGGGVGMAAGMVAGAAVGLKLFHDAVVRATDRLVEMNRHYAEVSASMAAVFAGRDVKEIMRDQEKGNRLSSSAQGLVDSEQRRKDGTKELEILADRVANGALSIANDLLAGLLLPLNLISQGINLLVDAIPDNPLKSTPADLGQFMEDVERRAVAPILARRQAIAEQQQADKEANNNKAFPRR